MNRMVRTITIAGTAGILAAGCTAASHLKALQPTPVPSSPAATIPAAGTSQMRLGIDLDAYTYPGQDVGPAAQAVASYVRRLHANALSIAFPFYMAGPTASAVQAGKGTPSVQQVQEIAQAAQDEGLYVSLRPLLDEASVGHQFRGRIQPASRSAWFTSYLHFLLPYAQMAAQQNIPEIITGTELSSLQRAPRWAAFNLALRRVYKGTLQFDTNWAGFPRLTGHGGTGVQEAVDAYPPIPAGHLLAGWEAYDRILPRGTIEAEVGIGAAPGAFTRPWLHQWLGRPVDESVQARWFTAACQAAAATHLGGIYFWSVGLGTTQPGPTTADPLSWAGGQGEAAISRCFASLGGKADQ